MKCQYCGNEIPFGSKNCPGCGAAAPQMPQQPQYQQGNNFQQPMNNGANVVVPPGYERKSRVVYILLALFLGGLGIHNFYAGYNGKGIAQLLIALIIGWLVFPLVFVGAWVIFEIITVSKDANGIPFS